MSLTELWLNYLATEDTVERLINFLCYKQIGGKRKCVPGDVKRFAKLPVGKYIRTYFKVLYWLILYRPDIDNRDGYMMMEIATELQEIVTVEKCGVIQDNLALTTSVGVLLLTKDLNWLDKFTSDYTALCKKLGIIFDFSVISKRLREYELPGID